MVSHIIFQPVTSLSVSSIDMERCRLYPTRHRGADGHLHTAYMDVESELDAEEWTEHFERLEVELQLVSTPLRAFLRDESNEPSRKLRHVRQTIVCKADNIKFSKYYFRNNVMHVV